MTDPKIATEPRKIHPRSALSYFACALLVTLFIATALLSLPATASPTETFAKSEKPVAGKNSAINHAAFTALLQQIITKDKNGLNRVDYKLLKSKRGALQAYIADLASQKPTTLAPDQQFAFWANLYNAVTLDTVVAAYPVSSIKDIDISPGLFSDGPWGKKLVTIEGTPLSLDDIEHEILRKNFADPRVHYAVNCASIGCPNLQQQAFTASKLTRQLDAAAKEYVNSPRGVVITDGEIAVSKIYSWFKGDFGTSDAKILAHLRRYAAAPLKARLEKAETIGDYFYDWSLNDTAR